MIAAFVKLLIRPPITGTTKKAIFEYPYLSQTVFIVAIDTGTAYLSQTVFIVAIDTGTAPKPNPVCPTAITAAS